MEKNDRILPLEAVNSMIDSVFKGIGDIVKNGIALTPEGKWAYVGNSSDANTSAISSSSSNNSSNSSTNNSSRCSSLNSTNPVVSDVQQYMDKVNDMVKYLDKISISDKCQEKYTESHKKLIKKFASISAVEGSSYSSFVRIYEELRINIEDIDRNNNSEIISTKKEVKKTIHSVLQWFNKKMKSVYNQCYDKMIDQIKFYFDQNIAVLHINIHLIDVQIAGRRIIKNDYAKALNRQADITKTIEMVSGLLPPGNKTISELTDKLMSVTTDIELLKYKLSRSNPKMEKYNLIKQIVVLETRRLTYLNNNIVPANLAIEFRDLMLKDFPYEDVTEHILQVCNKILSNYQISSVISINEVSDHHDCSWMNFTINFNH